MFARLPVCALIVFIAGCLPGIPAPQVDIGNTEAVVPEPDPPTVANAPEGHYAPVINFNPVFVTNDSLATMGAETDVKTPETQVTQQVTSDPPPQSSVPDAGGVDECVMVGPTWGGATIDDYNRAQCAKPQALAHRENPVGTVWEGCLAYWEDAASLNR